MTTEQDIQDVAMIAHNVIDRRNNRRLKAVRVD